MFKRWRSLSTAHERVNYYDVLGVRPDASDDDIKTAFRTKGARAHSMAVATPRASACPPTAAAALLDTPSHNAPSPPLYANAQRKRCIQIRRLELQVDPRPSSW